MTRHLTKSDFKLARTCAAKLYYRKQGYPQQTDQNSYLEMLAESGYIIEELVRLRFPEGQYVPEADSQQAAYQQTRQLLESHENITLFEATLIHEQKLARADILIRQGQQLTLIEIKSKSTDGTPDFWTKRGTIRSEWRPYLEDITFQTHVIEACFPEWHIEPQLVLVDKSSPIDIDHMRSYFIIESPAEQNTYQQQRVTITGAHEQLRNQNILHFTPVKREVNELRASVNQEAAYYCSSLDPLIRLEAPLTAHCQQCEFRNSDPAKSGFHECWRELSHASPHILDLYHIAEAGGRKLAQELIQQGSSHLFDIPLHKLQRTDGTLGAYGQRQKIQIEYTQKNEIWLDQGLAKQLETLVYPLHMIDFETARFALPSHKHMRPYSIEAFLWSCHTIHEDQQITHSEWINETNAYPNSTFATSLLNALSTQGSILTWSGYETSILKEIRQQLIERNQHQELSERIDELLTSKRITDMHALTKASYFHPALGPSTSLKAVADAIWQSEEHLRTLFNSYGIDTQHSSGFYSALTSAQINNQTIIIKEGTQAIQAYQTLLYLEQGKERTKWKQRLLEYCRHDTLAMILVWQHWQDLLGNQP